MSIENTIKPAEVYPADSEKEVADRADRLQDVLDEYVQDGATFRHKSAPNIAAFSADDEQMSTHFDNAEVVEAMVKVADSRGWGPLIVTGNNAFYSNAEAVIEGRQSLQENTVEQAEREATSEKSADKQSQPAPDVENEDSTPKIRSWQNQPVEPVDTQQEASADDDAIDQIAARRDAAMKKVTDQYRVAGNRYYFKDHSGSVNNLAFKDAGSKLTTSLNSERVSVSLVAMAEAKGWDPLRSRAIRSFVSRSGGRQRRGGSRYEGTSRQKRSWHP